MGTKIIFDKHTVNFILEAIGKNVDDKGFVIDRNTKLHELDAGGEMFRPEDLIGIIKQQYITKEIQLVHMVLNKDKS